MAASARAGRKTKYSDETVAKFIKAIAGGSTRKDACGHAGFSEDTLATWLKRYPDFADKVTRAESDGMVLHAANIQRCALGGQTIRTKVIEKTRPDGTVEKTTITELTPPDGRLSLEVLARRRSAEWAKTQTIKHSDPDGNKLPEPVLLDLSGLDTEDLDTLEAILTRGQTADARPDSGGEVTPSTA